MESLDINPQQVRCVLGSPLPCQQKCHKVEWGLWDEPHVLVTSGIAIRNQVTPWWDKPVEGAQLGLAVGKLLMAEHQAHGRQVS